MVFGLYNVELGKTQFGSPYTNMGTRKATVQTNMWGKYFTALNQKKQTTATNPYDSMAKLNNYYNSQNMNAVKSAEEIETQDIDETQEVQAQKPVDPKIGIAKGKLGKLTTALSKSDFPKVTQKLDNSIKLLLANPELSYLAAGFKEKLGAAAEKFSNLISKGMDSLSDDNLNASELNQLIDKIKDESKQLQSDWKKVISGYTKAGAYSEAMLLVNNDKNKNKYKEGALEAVADLPDFRVEQNSAKSAASADETDNNQDVETNPDNSTDNELITDDFAQDINIETDTNISDISANPFETDTKVSEEAPVQTEDIDTELEESADNDVDGSSDSDSDTNDNEINKLKDKVKEDLKKENVQNPEAKRITVDTIDGKKTLKSVLFD